MVHCVKEMGWASLRRKSLRLESKAQEEGLHERISEIASLPSLEMGLSSWCADTCR